MARREENECCGCAAPLYPCRGDACPLRHVVHWECDECGSENETLYYFNGEEVCADCIEKMLTPSVEHRCKRRIKQIKWDDTPLKTGPSGADIRRWENLPTEEDIPADTEDIKEYLFDIYKFNAIDFDVYLLCDECEEESDDLYEYEGQSMCLECILGSLDTVDQE